MSVVRMSVAALALMLMASPLAAQNTRAQRPMMRDSLMPCPTPPANGGGMMRDTAMARGAMMRDTTRARGGMMRDTTMARGGMMRDTAMARGSMMRDSAATRRDAMRPAADSMRPPCRPNPTQPN